MHSIQPCDVDFYSVSSEIPIRRDYTSLLSSLVSGLSQSIMNYGFEIIFVVLHVPCRMMRRYKSEREREGVKWEERDRRTEWQNKLSFNH